MRKSMLEVGQGKDQDGEEEDPQDLAEGRGEDPDDHSHQQGEEEHH